MSIARLLLLLKSGLADISTPQLDVEDALHGTQHLLIGRGGASLKIGHNGRRGVALCGELLLRESLGLEVGAGFLNGEADVLADFPHLTHEDILACLAFATERERRLTSVPAV